MNADLTKFAALETDPSIITQLASEGEADKYRIYVSGGYILVDTKTQTVVSLPEHYSLTLENVMRVGDAIIYNASDAEEAPVIQFGDSSYLFFPESKVVGWIRKQ